MRDHALDPKHLLLGIDARRELGRLTHAEDELSVALREQDRARAEERTSA